MAKADLPQIPERLSFRIGEASRLVGVKPHVLRFWEGEFGRVRPQKNRSGHRLYSRADLDLLRRIRLLLRDHRYTIAGARALLQAGDAAVEQVLAGPSVAGSAPPADSALAAAQRLEGDLRGVRADLASEIRRVAAAREEALFWRGEARRAEAALAIAVEHMAEHALALEEIVRRS